MSAHFPASMESFLQEYAQHQQQQKQPQWLLSYAPQLRYVLNARAWLLASVQLTSQALRQLSDDAVALPLARETSRLAARWQELHDDAGARGLLLVAVSLEGVLHPADSMERFGPVCESVARDGSYALEMATNDGRKAGKWMRWMAEEQSKLDWDEVQAALRLWPVPPGASVPAPTPTAEGETEPEQAAAAAADADDHNEL